MVIKMCWKSILQKYEKDIAYCVSKIFAEIFSSQHPGSRAAPGNNSATPANSSARCLVASVGTDSRCVDIRLDSDDNLLLVDRIRNHQNDDI